MSFHNENLGWSGGCDANRNGQWGQAWNGQNEQWPDPGRNEFFDDSQQFWAHDLRRFATNYQDWFLNGVIIESWSRKKKHSERHAVRVRDYFANSWHPNPNSQPWGALVNSGNLSWQYIWTSKNGVRSKWTTHYLNRDIPMRNFINSPLYTTMSGDPNSRREYGFIRVQGIQVWRERPGFPGSVQQVLLQNGRNVPGLASQLVAGNYLTSFRGQLEYMP